MAKKKTAKKKTAKKTTAKKKSAKKTAAKKKSAKKTAAKKTAAKPSKVARKSSKPTAKKESTKTGKKRAATKRGTTKKAPKTAPKEKTSRKTPSSSPPDVAAAAPADKMSKLSPRRLQRIRELLFQKRSAIRNHLESELLELEKPEEKRHRADLEEVASDTHEKDSLCEILDIEASQIDQIEVALRKIENGTYGICEDCGERIAPARLEALPFASQCIECKRQAETRGGYSTPYTRL
jgi:DnaK suppressor protein